MLGETVAPTFASAERVIRLRPLLDEFLREIFELDPETCFVTDESTLHDFSMGHPLEPIFAEIHRRFGVNVSSVPGANLAEVLERISTERSG